MYFNSYTYGWINGNINGHKVYWHNGGSLGTTCFIVVIPDLKIAVATFFNVLFVDLDGLFLATYIVDQVTGNAGFVNEETICYLAWVTPLFNTSYLDLPSIVENPNIYVGRYFSKTYGVVELYVNPENSDEVIFEIGNNKGKLRVQDGHKFLWFTEDFFVMEPFVLTFNVKNGKAKAFTAEIPFDPNDTFEKCSNSIKECKKN